MQKRALRRKRKSQKKKRKIKLNLRTRRRLSLRKKYLLVSLNLILESRARPLMKRRLDS
jgi:hypothetical protein